MPSVVGNATNSVEPVNRALSPQCDMNKIQLRVRELQATVSLPKMRGNAWHKMIGEIISRISPVQLVSSSNRN